MKDREVSSGSGGPAGTDVFSYKGVSSGGAFSSGDVLTEVKDREVASDSGGPAGTDVFSYKGVTVTFCEKEDAEEVVKRGGYNKLVHLQNEEAHVSSAGRYFDLPTVMQRRMSMGRTLQCRGQQILRYIKDRLSPLIMCKDVVAKCVLFLYITVEGNKVKPDDLSSRYEEVLGNMNVSNICIIHTAV